MLTWGSTSKIEKLSSVSRCTCFRYLCHISGLGLIQADNPHIVFSNHPSFPKLLTYMFMLDLDTSIYPALHDLINRTTNSYNTLFLELDV